MNTRTLGSLQTNVFSVKTKALCFCTSRIGRADIDVASRAVDLFVSLRANPQATMNSRARQLCYPRSNFSLISSPNQGGHRGSLDHIFMPAFHLVKNTVRLAFALALYCGFLTRLSQPLGPVDIISTGCHPSQTIRLLLSFLRSKQRRF